MSSDTANRPNVLFFFTDDQRFNTLGALNNPHVITPHLDALVARGTAFTNGYIHYGPPAAYYDKGGYEATECFLAPAWQALYERKAADVIRRLR